MRAPSRSQLILTLLALTACGSSGSSSSNDAAGGSGGGGSGGAGSGGAITAVPRLGDGKIDTVYVISLENTDWLKGPANPVLYYKNNPGAPFINKTLLAD